MNMTYSSKENKGYNSRAKKANRATHELQDSPVPLMGRVDVSR